MGYHPRLINNILAIFITYIANLGVPRSGEFFRATVLQTYEDIPFEKSFGTIIAERTIDLIMLLLTIGLALTLESDLIYSLLEEKAINPYNVIAILLGCSLGIYFLVKQLKKSTHPLAQKSMVFLTAWPKVFLPSSK